MNSTPNEDDSVDDFNADELSYLILSIPNDHFCLNALKSAISAQHMTYFLCFPLIRFWGTFSML